MCAFYTDVDWVVCELPSGTPTWTAGSTQMIEIKALKIPRYAKNDEKVTGNGIG